MSSPSRPPREPRGGTGSTAYQCVAVHTTMFMMLVCFSEADASGQCLLWCKGAYLTSLCSIDTKPYIPVECVSDTSKGNRCLRRYKL